MAREVIQICDRCGNKRPYNSEKNTIAVKIGVHEYHVTILMLSDNCRYALYDTDDQPDLCQDCKAFILYAAYDRGTELT